MKEPEGKYMFGTVKVGEKGQIVIPKKARDIFDISPGDMLLLLGDDEEGIAIVPPSKLNRVMKLVTKIMKEEDGEE